MQFGALPFIYGTVITSFLALLISVPLGVGAAIYLSELAPPKLSNTLTFLVELLAAVPSVIYGLLAIFTLVPLMRDYIGPGIQKVSRDSCRSSAATSTACGYLTAGMILAIMTFPFIISVSREALMAVPREQREAALALGATKWESTWQVVVPFARLGIIGSIFLALARALGETMAVTMVIGNDTSIHASLFAPGYTIAAVIANEFTEATGNTYLVGAGGTGSGAVRADHGHQRPGAVVDCADDEERLGKSMTSRNSRRNAVNNVMLSLSGVCAVVTVSTLFLILGYLVYNGGKSVDLNFFTKLPLRAGTRRRRHGERDPRQRSRSWCWQR